MAYDEGLADRVRSILARRKAIPRGTVFEKKMFGGLVFMIDGNMCCGVRNSELMLRLSVDGAAGALRHPHTRLVDETGQRMKTFVFVNERGTDLEHELEEWIKIALEFVRTLEPKAPSEKPRPKALSQEPSRRVAPRAKGKTARKRSRSR